MSSTGKYHPGYIVWAQPPKVNDGGVPITKTTGGKITKHPIIVLHADDKTNAIRGLLITSFNKSTSLAEVSKNVHTFKEAEYKWFLPIKPAPVEHKTHKPIDLEVESGSSGNGEAQWVNMKDLLTVPDGDVVSLKAIYWPYST